MMSAGWKRSSACWETASQAASGSKPPDPPPASREIPPAPPLAPLPEFPLPPEAPELDPALPPELPLPALPPELPLPPDAPWSPSLPAAEHATAPPNPQSTKAQARVCITQRSIGHPSLKENGRPTSPLGCATPQPP